jgi:hypothetical protein
VVSVVVIAADAVVVGLSGSFVPALKQNLMITTDF